MKFSIVGAGAIGGDLGLAGDALADIALRHLRQREAQRYGGRIQQGGDMHEQSQAFLQWAAGYEQGDLHTRSLLMHETWMARHLSCPLLRLDSTQQTPEQLAERVLSWLQP